MSCIVSLRNNRQIKAPLNSGAFFGFSSESFINSLKEILVIYTRINTSKFDEDSLLLLNHCDCHIF